MSEDYYLTPGHHRTPKEGRCAMEWIAFIAGERHSDKPASVSPLLRGLMMSFNDGLSDKPRQRLRPYLVRCIGTNSDGLDLLREPIVVRIHDEMRMQLHVDPPATLRAGGHLDRFENRIFGEDGWLEQLLPLMPWPSEEIKRVRVAEQRRREFQRRIVKPTTQNFAEALEIAIGEVPSLKYKVLPAQSGELLSWLDPYKPSVEALVAKHEALIGTL